MQTTAPEPIDVVAASVRPGQADARRALGLLPHVAARGADNGDSAPWLSGPGPIVTPLR